MFEKVTNHSLYSPFENNVTCLHHILSILPQGKFIRIHFGPSGKLAGADIETCKYSN